MALLSACYKFQWFLGLNNFLVAAIFMQRLCRRYLLVLSVKCRLSSEGLGPDTRTGGRYVNCNFVFYMFYRIVNVALTVRTIFFTLQVFYIAGLLCGAHQSASFSHTLTSSRGVHRISCPCWGIPHGFWCATRWRSNIVSTV